MVKAMGHWEGATMLHFHDSTFVLLAREKGQTQIKTMKDKAGGCGKTYTLFATLIFANSISAIQYCHGILPHSVHLENSA